MSVLSDEKLKKIYIDAYYKASNEAGLVGAGLVAIRAVAEAAVRAEREGAVPFGWYFMDDPKVYTMPGSGFRVGPDRPADTLHASPLYLHPPQASATVPEGYRLQPLSEFDAMLNTRTVPDGWKLVPVVPTEEMLIASMRGVDYGTGVGLEHKKKLSSRQWKAMLAAAPSRPGDEPSAHQVVVENVAAFNGDIPMPGDGEETQAS